MNNYDNLLDLNLREEENRILDFIRKTVSESKKKGVVIGISGGIDSAVVAQLCVKALNKENVLSILMFEKDKNNVDYKHAKNLINTLSVKFIDYSITDIFNTFVNNLYVTNDKIALGNIKARIRMTLLYYYANIYDYLVVGTGDLSEKLMGYFTKYGDGGADFFPISHLYKSQIKQLAKYFDLDEEIIKKPSSPNLWDNHKASDELPLEYEKLDLVLFKLFKEQISDSMISQQLNIPINIIAEISNRMKINKHKHVSQPQI
tara:strand:+ start:182 stop:964 length:783 start_codon:yes stop_codon:yes gene_type:complete